MAELNLKQIIDRLNAEFTGETRKLVFWYDDKAEFAEDMETVEKKEFFAGKEYTEYWRAGDIVDILPRGEHIRLYQRDNSIPKYYPTADDVEFTGASDRGPTQQSPTQ